MRLHEISIKRHVLAFMMSGLIVLFGLVGYDRIGLDRYPDIEFPMVSVTTVMVGANPDVIDASITNLIESAVNSIPGIDHIESSSAPGVSAVTVKFILSKDLDVAFNEVQAKVNQVLNALPEEAEPPIVAKVELGATPIMWLALQGDRTLQQLNQYVRLHIRKRLENLNGVGEVRIGGERERTIRVRLQPERMAAFGVAVDEVLAAFQRQHIRLPGGYLTSVERENLLKLDMEFHDLDALAGMVVAYREEAPIRLRDIAAIEDGLADFRQLASYNGLPTVSLGIVKVTGANTVAISRIIRERLENEIIPNLPPGLTLTVASDSADFIQEIVNSLEEHLVLGALMAALVVWFFLKNLRATLIIAVAIPVSLLGAVVVMYFGGFTFNTMTLLAMLLLIGVVVDDAIVVLENIHRFREEGERNPVRAAIRATDQVVFSILAATLTLVSIFAPVAFLEGIIGRFFSSFAVVVSFGVLTSLFVALTLTPMLCARHLTVSSKHGRLYRMIEGALRAMERVYGGLLRFALRFRWTMVALTIASVYASGPFFAEIGKGFLPHQDEGRFIVTFKTPTGSSLAYSEERLRAIGQVLDRHPEIAGHLATIGVGARGRVSEGSVAVELIPRSERTLHQYGLIDLLREELSDLPGVQAFPSPVSVVGGQRGEPLQFALSGPELGQVARFAEILKARFADMPQLGRVDLDLQMDLPQLRLRVDRVRAAHLGLSARDAAVALNVLAGGFDVAKYNDEPGDGERYDIRLQAGSGEVVGPDDLARIYLRSRQGELARLDGVARLEPSLGPAAIPRYDLQYAANFFSTPTVDLGAAVADVMRVSSELLPPGYSVRMKGRAEEFGKTMGYMKFTFGMALLLVYMVLASQFNSFIQPLLIMLAQPLAIIGGGFGLWLFDHSLNIFSMIGLVLLMGLVAKNSILLVDLTNQMRAEGKEIREALLTACPIRLRPVVMTSLTIILAMLPAAMTWGAGADANAPLAVAVIGGMISSTLLTLVVVPAVYSLVENGLLRWKRFAQRFSSHKTAEAQAHGG